MNILFCESFTHEKAADNVDEVRFEQPVLVNACHIVEQHHVPHEHITGFKGITSPSSFSLEIYARGLPCSSNRFELVCKPLAYISSTHDVVSFQSQPLETDHLVFRGSYRALSVLIYGSRVLHKQESSLTSPQFPSGKNDAHSSDNAELGQLWSVASDWPSEHEPMLSLRHLVLKKASADLPESKRVILRQAVKEGIEQPSSLCSSELRQTIVCAIASSNTPSQSDDIAEEKEEQVESQSLAEEEEEVDMLLRSIRLAANPSHKALQLEAVQTVLSMLLLASQCPRRSYLFVTRGGLQPLLVLLSGHVQGAALRSLEGLCRHSFVCHELLGFWGQAGKGKAEPAFALLLSLMLRGPSLGVHTCSLARILARLRVHQICGHLQAVLDPLLCPDTEPPPGADSATSKSADLILQLKVALNLKVAKDEDWPPTVAAARWLARDPLEFPTPPGILPIAACYGKVAVSSASAISYGPDEDLISILEEHRILQLLGSFLSVPWLQAVPSNLLHAVETLLLSLLDSRPGLLLLGGHPEDTALLCAALAAAGEEQVDCGEPARRTLSTIASTGVAFHPEDVARAIRYGMAALSACDSLLAPSPQPSLTLEALWRLTALLQRGEAGRQAVVAAVRLPQVMVPLAVMLEAPDQGSMPRARKMLAAQLLTAMVSDWSACTLSSWVPRAFSLHAAASAAEEGVLQAWLEPAVVYSQKGLLALLQLFTSLAPPDNTHNVDLHPPHTVSKLSSCLRLLAVLCCQPGVAAILYAEGVLTPLQLIAGHCSAAFRQAAPATGSSDAVIWISRLQRQAVELVVPTLLLLLPLLHTLRDAVPLFRSTWLQDNLLELFWALSSHAAFYEAGFPLRQTALSRDLLAIRGMLVPLLACWPAASWQPALLPRLLGIARSAKRGATVHSSFPVVEPRHIAGLLSLLGDLLPRQACLEAYPKDDLQESSQIFAACAVLGSSCTAEVLMWHTLTPYVEKVVRAFLGIGPQLAQLICRASTSTCSVLRAAMKRLLCRAACVSPELSRPILAALLTSLSADAGESEVVSRLRLVEECSTNQVIKVLLGEEGAVQAILALLNLPSASNGVPHSSTVSRLNLAAIAALQPFCATSRTGSSEVLPARSYCEDWALPGDLESIAVALLPALAGRVSGAETLGFLQLLEAVCSRDAGRAAVGIAVSTLETEDIAGPLLLLCHSLLPALSSDEQDGTQPQKILSSLVAMGMALTDAGGSECGIAALKWLMAWPPVTEEQQQHPLSQLSAGLDFKAGADAEGQLGEELARLLEVLRGASVQSEAGLVLDLAQALKASARVLPPLEERLSAAMKGSPLIDNAGHQQQLVLQADKDVLQFLCEWQTSGQANAREQVATEVNSSTSKRKQPEADSAASAAAVAGITRHDSFRQRKVNTVRTDDSPAAPGGRAPSVHVDEFMAREQQAGGRVPVGAPVPRVKGEDGQPAPLVDSKKQQEAPLQVLDNLATGTESSTVGSSVPETKPLPSTPAPPAAAPEPPLQPQSSGQPSGDESRQGRLSAPHRAPPLAAALSPRHTVQVQAPPPPFSPRPVQAQAAVTVTPARGYGEAPPMQAHYPAGPGEVRPLQAQYPAGPGEPRPAQPHYPTTPGEARPTQAHYPAGPAPHWPQRPASYPLPVTGPHPPPGLPPSGQALFSPPPPGQPLTQMHQHHPGYQPPARPTNPPQWQVFGANSLGSSSSGMPVPPMLPGGLPYSPALSPAAGQQCPPSQPPQVLPPPYPFQPIPQNGPQQGYASPSAMPPKAPLIKSQQSAPFQPHQSPQAPPIQHYAGAPRVETASQLAVQNIQQPREQQVDLAQPSPTLPALSQEAIQELLRDPSKLQQLLEQHPRLVSMLQAKLSAPS